MSPYKISFIGAGKLANAFCMELFNAGCTIVNIVSDKGNSAVSLAQKCKSSGSSELIIPDITDILIVSVPDHKLKEVLHKVICRDNMIIAHTSGSSGPDVFPERFSHTGMIYPLQTFSLDRTVDFKEIPFFIEASDNNTANVLESLATGIGKSVHYTNPESRIMLHLAAVFASNFTNQMLTEGKEIAARAGFSFDVLIPLINETIKKAIETGPEKSQTGPAVRNDLNTIEKHMELLSFYPELRNIYREVSNSIIKRYKK